MRLAAFQAIIYQVTATASVFRLCLHLLHCKNKANVTSCQPANTLTRELTASQNNMQENRKIIEYKIIKVGSIQMRVVDGKQKYYYLEWPKGTENLRKPMEPYFPAVKLIKQ